MAENTPGSLPVGYRPDQYEGMYKMFVTMMVLSSTIYAWYTLNNCNVTPRGKMIMTFVMASLLTFSIITVWFSGAYVYKEENGKMSFRMNGIHSLTKDMPHFLSGSGNSGLSECMKISDEETPSEYDGSYAISDTQRNFRHLFVSSMLAIILSGILAAFKV
tara:strand:+ start:1129 stop:1611 length:483 start_codon:yes stop_codon:yes gene_type:complete